MHLEEIVFNFFPHGKRKGKYVRVGDIEGKPGKSLAIDMTGISAGCWYDFNTKEGGDILKLWGLKRGLSLARCDFPELLYSLQEYLCTPCEFRPGPPIEIDQVASAPVTSSSQASESQRPEKRDKPELLGIHSARWDYHDADGGLLACIYRYETEEGKVFRPWDVKERKHKAPTPRPLFNQPGIQADSHIILVEGEKCAEALIQAGFTATTAMNGASAPIDKTDWSPLWNKHLLIWPDKDKPGQDYAKAVSAYLTDKGIAASISMLEPPEDKPEKWDAFDAIAEGIDVNAFISSHTRLIEQAPLPLITPAYKAEYLFNDTSPIPEDLISPRILIPGGLLVFAGAPKVGKSDFLLSMIVHMAAGVPFLGLRPPRPLRVFYLQSEVGYYYLRERLNAISIDKNLRSLVGNNLVVTPQVELLLDEKGTQIVANTINHHFGDEKVDVIVIDPLRNVFDGGESGVSENDNAGMLFFLQKRINVLRNLVNPEAGLMICHHTRKMPKKQLEEDPFQALCGASSLRGFYTTGLVMYQLEENRTYRELVFELRNGAGLKNKIIDKIDGAWEELDSNSRRLIRRHYGQKLDAERRRREDVILDLIYVRAEQGHIYRTYALTKLC